MGIYKFYEIVGRDASEIHNASDLAGTRLAIDMPIIFYKFLRTSGEAVENVGPGYVDRLLSFLMFLRSHRIKPICIFEGDKVPKEKLEEQLRRRKSENKQKERLDRLEELCLVVKRYFNSEIPQEMREEIKNLLGRGVNKLPDDPFETYKLMKDTAKKRRLQSLVVTEEVKRVFEEVIVSMGFPVIKAEGEAEALCVKLCYMGMVDAVLSEDTDIFAYVPDFETDRDLVMVNMVSSSKFSLLSKKDILERMDMNELTFRDMCILCGCDYNDGIKGVGPVTIKKYFSLYERLEDIKNISKRLPELKHEKCRELFTVSKEDIKIPCNKKPSVERLERLLTLYRSFYTVDQILECYVTLE